MGRRHEDRRLLISINLVIIYCARIKTTSLRISISFNLDYVELSIFNHYEIS